MATERIDETAAIAEDNELRAQLAKVEAETTSLKAQKAALLDKSVLIQMLKISTWKRDESLAECRRLEAKIAKLRAGLGNERPVSMKQETHADRPLSWTEKCRAAREKEQTN